MSFVEARNAAAELGYELVAVGNGYTERRRGPDGNFEANRSVGFCEKKLSVVTFNMKGGFSAFAKTVADLEARYGPGSTASSSEYGQYGLKSAVKITYALKDGTFHTVSMTEIGSHGANAAHMADFSAIVCR